MKCIKLVVGKKKPLPSDDYDSNEEEDVDIDVEEDSDDGSFEVKDLHVPRKLLNANNNTTVSSSVYNSPRRRTRSCVVPDALKTKETVTLDDLMKHRFLRPGKIPFPILF